MIRWLFRNLFSSAPRYRSHCWYNEVHQARMALPRMVRGKDLTNHAAYWGITRKRWEPDFLLRRRVLRTIKGFQR